MRKLGMAFLFFVSITVGNAQDVISKKVGDFKQLKVFNKIQVTLVHSDENKVEVTGIKRRDVDIVHDNDLLKIRMSLNNLWDNNNTKVTVYYKEINKIDVNEGSKVEVEGVIKENSLDLRVQEGAILAANITTDNLYAKAITGGELYLRGSVKDQEVVVNAGGAYYAKALKTEDAQVKISAGGRAEVNVKNYIKANTNAGGIIEIYGNPREIDSQKLLGGKIIEVN